MERSLQGTTQLIACPEWLDGNALLNRCGARIVDSLELTAYLLHPAQHPLPARELADGIAWRRLPSR